MTKQLKQKIEKAVDEKFGVLFIPDPDGGAFSHDVISVTAEVEQFILEQVKESVVEVIGDKAHYHFIQNEQERNNQNVFEVDAYNKLRDIILNKLNEEL
jgi:hypothetical protein